MGECVEQLSSFVLQDGVVDRWVWKLDLSHCYMVKSAYSYLTAVDNNIIEGFDRFLWLKAIPLKVNIFV